jgi:hypothetical protein
VVVRTPQGGPPRVYWKGKRLKAGVRGFAQLVVKGEEFDLMGPTVTFKGELLNVHRYDDGDVSVAYDPLKTRSTSKPTEEGRVRCDEKIHPSRLTCSKATQ